MCLPQWNVITEVSGLNYTAFLVQLALSIQPGKTLIDQTKYMRLRLPSLLLTMHRGTMPSLSTPLSFSLHPDKPQKT